MKSSDSIPDSVAMKKDEDITQFKQRLEQVSYVAGENLAATLLLFTYLERPLLLEGEAGVGKTAVAKALADLFECPLIRLQCYEGLDASTTVYEWDYQRQLLAIKLQESTNATLKEKEKRIFDKEYLLERPLLKAITMPTSPVLLIDEIDRADEEFEAYLLEVLSEFQISIPELGTITATCIPHVVLTSNSSRELSDALRRRCLYHYVDYPDAAKELRIIYRRMPDISEDLARQVIEFVHALRRLDLQKKPGIAETLDWVKALLRIQATSLDEDVDTIAKTMLCLLKTKEDIDMVSADVIHKLVAQAV